MQSIRVPHRTDPRQSARPQCGGAMPGCRALQKRAPPSRKGQGPGGAWNPGIARGRRGSVASLKQSVEKRRRTRRACSPTSQAEREIAEWPGQRCQHQSSARTANSQCTGEPCHAQPGSQNSVGRLWQVAWLRPRGLGCGSPSGGLCSHIQQRAAFGVPRPSLVGLALPPQIGAHFLARHGAFAGLFDVRAPIKRHRPDAPGPLPDKLRLRCNLRRQPRLCAARLDISFQVHGRS